MKLELERNFKASSEKIYNIWIDQSQISLWFGVDVEIEPKVGGKLRFIFDKEKDITTGVYKELVPFSKVSFTWNSMCNGESTGETLVSVFIESISDSTSKIRLEHSGFDNEKMKNTHIEGWMDYFGKWEEKLV